LPISESNTVALNVVYNSPEKQGHSQANSCSPEEAPELRVIALKMYFEDAVHSDASDKKSKPEYIKSPAY
jgi:hypothetical protein